MLEPFPIDVALLCMVNAQAIAGHMQRELTRVLQYAALPAHTAPPIWINGKLELGDGTHRLCAAQLRGDRTILCFWHSDVLRERALHPEDIRLWAEQAGNW